MNISCPDPRVRAFARTLGYKSKKHDQTLKGLAAWRTLSGLNEYFIPDPWVRAFARTLGYKSKKRDQTLKGLAGWRTLSGLNEYFMSGSQGCRSAPALGWN